MIKGLLFDFDGLLVDTEGPAYHAWQELFQERGHDLPLERWTANVGTLGEPFDPLEYLASLTGLELDRDALKQQYLARELELGQAEELREGVADYIRAAEQHGLRVAIVSSASERWIRRHISRLSVEHVWACLVCANGDPDRAKPAPHLYLEALDTLRIEAREAVAFEDSLNGVRAAKSAGLFTVAVPNEITAGLALDEADLVVESLGRLPLEELLSHVSAAA